MAEALTNSILATVLAVGVTALSAAACSSEGPAGGAPPGTGAAPGGPGGSAVTFARDVEPLVQDKCQRCHREGGVAPFSLVTYDQVKGAGLAALTAIRTRAMPPWGAYDDDACRMQHAFKDDLRLTDAQIALFGAWVDQGMPLGDAAARPAPRTFPSDGLEGKTATLTMAQPYTVPAGGPDDIRCFPIDPGFTTDTWVGGVNVVPGNPKVVHHVIVYTDPKGESPAKAGAAGSYPCFGGPGVPEPSLLLAWAPGARPVAYEDAGLKVAAGAKLVMQVHYHPTSETQTDASAFELKTLATKPANVAQILLLGNADDANGRIALLPGPNDPPEGPAFFIPAGAKAHTETMELTLPETLQGFPLPTLGIATLGAHMHWAGVDMKIEVERKTAAAQPAKECLLGTPEYDFNWQRGYVIDAPMSALPTIAAGDKLRFTCTYDNSTDNPAVRKAMAEQRLAAPVDIRLGEQTMDEMCLGVLAVVRPITAFD